MKKMLAIPAALLLLFNIACHEQEPEYQAPKAKAKATPKITIVDERSDSEPNNNMEEVEVKPRMEGSGSWKSDEGCAIIPDPPESCFPCAGQSRAGTEDELKKFMDQHMKTCIDKFQQAGDNGCKPSQKAIFKDGSCVLVNLTESERAAMEADVAKMKKHHESQQGKHHSGGHPSGAMSSPANQPSYGSSMTGYPTNSLHNSSEPGYAPNYGQPSKGIYGQPNFSRDIPWNNAPGFSPRNPSQGSAAGFGPWNPSQGSSQGLGSWGSQGFDVRNPRGQGNNFGFPPSGQPSPFSDGLFNSPMDPSRDRSYGRSPLGSPEGWGYNFPDKSSLQNRPSRGPR
jgi:hypothetical protein